MSGIQEIEGQLTVRGARIALLVSRFNSFIVESLLDGAVDALKRHGAEERDLQIVRVPGAYEMPIAAQRLSSTSACARMVFSETRSRRCMAARSASCASINARFSSSDLPRTPLP